MNPILFLIILLVALAGVGIFVTSVIVKNIVFVLLVLVAGMLWMFFRSMVE